MFIGGVISKFNFNKIVQMVEHWNHKSRVMGSNPIFVSTFLT